ncbi:MAG: prolipoprotein diacylglyceryl transferase [Anaerolineaceae bacterium]|nr:prolipoprotein diacylglyceryl transferase [Anaerolineaceae bacterium]
MLPVINIGPLALPAPQLILLIGFWLGLEISEKQASHFKIDAAKIYNLVLIAMLAGLVGARLAYAIQSPAAFRESPLNLLALRPEMLDGTGGWLAALAAGLIYMRVKKLALWPAFDAVSGLLVVLGVSVGLAHLASGDAFGAPTQLPWAIRLWGAQRHPSQVYETLAALLVGIATWPGRRISRASIQPGREGLRFWAFIALSAAARIFLEAFRGDSILLADSLRIAQLVAWVALGFSLWQIGRRIQLASATAPKEQAMPEENEPV